MFRILCWIPFLSWQIVWGILSIFQIYSPPFLNSAVTIAAVFLIAEGAYCGSIRKKLLFSASYLLFIIISESVVWYSFQLLFSAEAMPEILGASVLARVLEGAEILILYRLLRWKKLVTEDGKCNRYFLVLTLGNMIVAYAVFWSYDQLAGSESLSLAVLVVIILLLLNMFVYIMFEKMYEAAELKQENERWEHQMELYVRYWKEKEERDRELRRFRHDLKQKMLGLKHLIELHDDIKAMEFIQNELNILSEKKPDKINTGNFAIDAILNDRYRSSLKDGIRFQTYLDMPAQLPYGEGDLCVLLGNLLDNGWEAALRDENPDRYVDIRIIYDRDNLIITEKNNFDGTFIQNKSGGFETIKEDAVNHGLGLESIRKIAEKYHGNVCIECREKVFKIQVLLYSLNL